MSISSKTSSSSLKKPEGLSALTDRILPPFQECERVMRAWYRTYYQQLQIGDVYYLKFFPNAVDEFKNALKLYYKQHKKFFEPYRTTPMSFKTLSDDGHIGLSGFDCGLNTNDKVQLINAAFVDNLNHSDKSAVILKLLFFKDGSVKNVVAMFGGTYVYNLILSYDKERFVL